jgi:hypothetical protein
MSRLSERKKAELELIAALTLDATLAAEEKLYRLAKRTKTASRILGKKSAKRNSERIRGSKR